MPFSVAGCCFLWLWPEFSPLSCREVTVDAVPYRVHASNHRATARFLLWASTDRRVAAGDGPVPVEVTYRVRAQEAFLWEVRALGVSRWRQEAMSCGWACGAAARVGSYTEVFTVPS